MTIDRRYKTFADIMFAAALLNPLKQVRTSLTHEEVWKAKTKIRSFSAELDDVIDTAEVQLKRMKIPENCKEVQSMRYFHKWDFLVPKKFG